MNAELQRVFDAVPEDDPRSRLEPYRELILRWRRQGRSYRRISELMAEKFAVQVAYATVFGFVQRRSRPRQVAPEAEPKRETERTTIPPAIADRKVDKWADARHRMEQAKNEPAPVLKPKLFDYPESDSIEPLVMLPKIQKEN